MGKADRIAVTKRVRHAPLAEQITQEDVVIASGRTKTRRKNDPDQPNEYVDSRLSKSILSEAREQQKSFEGSSMSQGPSGSFKGRGPKGFHRNTMLGSDSEGEDVEDTQDFDEYNAEEFEVDPECARQMEMFMRSKIEQQRTLADIIMEKLTAKATEIKTEFSDGPTMPDINPEVAEMYQGVGNFLSKYRAGRLPKAFKIIPSLQNWEEILYITEPDKWTAAAMYQGTRLFASNLKENMAQRFYNLILLPRVRDDIDEFKKLNYHLYRALRKAMFKPGAFFKGIILPICESGTCTLREAIILSSVLTKNSVPVLHACACMLKLAEMEYSGANSIFLRVLLDKKYTLPYRVIDAVVYHFLRFERDKREMPVLWHQCFLTFAQRYKEDISDEQKDALLKLLKIHNHPKISDQVRYEYHNAKSRDVAQQEPME